MKEEEFDSLLSEIAKDETTLERKVEIVDLIKNDRKQSSDKYQELVTNTAKLQDDYKQLQAKKVDEFFHKGTNVENPDNNLDNQQLEPKKEEPFNAEDIAKKLLGRSEE
nr:MAG TPA: hypothetical protein [Caudoviricetes sp.]